MRWNSSTFTWDSLNQFWELVSEVTTTSGRVDPVKVEKLGKDKKKKLVRLIMHMKGIKVYDEQKEIKNIHHKLEDIKLVVEEIKKHVQIIYG